MFPCIDPTPSGCTLTPSGRDPKAGGFGLKPGGFRLKSGGCGLGSGGFHPSVDRQRPRCIKTLPMLQQCKPSLPSYLRMHWRNRQPSRGETRIVPRNDHRPHGPDWLAHGRHARQEQLHQVRPRERHAPLVPRLRQRSRRPRPRQRPDHQSRAITKPSKTTRQQPARRACWRVFVVPLGASAAQETMVFAPRQRSPGLLPSASANHHHEYANFICQHQPPSLRESRMFGVATRFL